MTEVHAEIEYFPNKNKCHIHSDVCPPRCSSDNMHDPEWRELIHSALDEWIDESKGTGVFYIKQGGYDPFGHQELVKSLSQRINSTRIEIKKQLIGSCNCLTKSDEDVYHAPDCRYRKLREILKVLDNKE